MLYVHDVWVNWFEDEENPNLIPYYHEWKRDDIVDLMDQIPLLKVNSNLFNYIVYGLNEVANDILRNIEDKAFERKNHERKKIKYSFICTDGERVMAIELDQYGYVHKKSRLIPRQFQLVMEMIEGKSFDFELNDQIDVSQYNMFAGLTRNEKEVLFVSTDFVNNIKPEKFEMLKYIIAELDINLYKKLAADSFDEIKHRILEKLRGSETGSLIELNKLITKLKLIN